MVCRGAICFGKFIQTACIAAVSATNDYDYVRYLCQLRYRILPLRRDIANRAMDINMIHFVFDKSKHLLE